ncbi:MAG: protein kinase [Bacillota bacterium]|nr:protein kinase [Bacillota bacterium]
MLKRENEAELLSNHLAGYLGALFGVEFGLYLSSEACFSGMEIAVIEEQFSPEESKVANLLKVIDLELSAERFDNARKYCLLLFSLLEDVSQNKKAGKYLCRRPHRLSVLYRTLMQLGDFLFDHGLPKEALIFYRELLKDNPLDPLLIKKSGRACYTMGPSYLNEAELLYRQALKQNPKDLDIYESLGRIMENFPEREKEVFLLYRDALRYCLTDMDKIRFYLRLLILEPDDSQLLLRLGRLYRRMGMFIEARKYLEDAFRLDKDFWTALDLSYIYYLLNDLVRAEETLNLSLLEDSPDAAHSRIFFLGLIKESSEQWSQAEKYYRIVTPDHSLFWKAQIGLARVLLHQGKFIEAEELSAGIPAQQRISFRSDFMKLCELMDDSTEERYRGGKWRECICLTDSQYELRKDIGRRSMGESFWRKYEAVEAGWNVSGGQIILARERASGKKVVIKQISKDLLSDPLVVRRILGLLRTVRAMSNPGIAALFEDCYYDDCFFYAMEYMSGGNLTELISSRAPLTVTRAAGIVLQITAALDYIYREKGAMLYGALKPENILFSDHDAVKISDIDLLWALEGNAVYSSSVLQMRRSFLENYLYAAPERFNRRGFLSGRMNAQSRNSTLEMSLQGVDHRADLYSLGLIFFELVTGILPFRERSLRAVVSFHRSGKMTSPRLFNPAVPPDLEEIILKLMHIDPHQRYYVPAEVKVAIEKARIL